MPIYDYVCTSCSTQTEFSHPIDAAPPRFCPACGTEGSLRKVFVPPTVHFRGSGWAKKDRSGAARSKAKAADSTSTDGKEATPKGSTTDAKPEPKDRDSKDHGAKAEGGKAASAAGEG